MLCVNFESLFIREYERALMSVIEKEIEREKLGFKRKKKTKE